MNVIKAICEKHNIEYIKLNRCPLCELDRIDRKIRIGNIVQWTAVVFILVVILIGVLK